MTKRLSILAAFVGLVVGATAQEIPSQLRGTWVVKRELPATTISCWGESDAKKLIGTEIEYAAYSFRWKAIVTDHPTVQSRVVSAEQFHEENSSPSANGSQVYFRQLGIAAPRVTEITLGHVPADITGATVEIPGDAVLIKDPDTIVFSVCGVYFEAHRRPTPQKYVK